MEAEVYFKVKGLLLTYFVVSAIRSNVITPAIKRSTPTDLDLELDCLILEEFR